MPPKYKLDAGDIWYDLPYPQKSGGCTGYPGASACYAT
jgi:hypothetical protein